MNDTVVAVLVGGPGNGTQVIVPRSQREYLVAEQKTLSWLSDMPPSVASTPRVRVHRYELVYPCVSPQLRGHVVFEWFGES
jgi:hypothetical protein